MPYSDAGSTSLIGLERGPPGIERGRWPAEARREPLRAGASQPSS